MAMEPEKAQRMTRFAWAGLVGACVLLAGVILLPHQDDAGLLHAARQASRDQTGQDQPEESGAVASEETEHVRWMELEALFHAVHEIAQATGPDDAESLAEGAADSDQATAPQTLDLAGWRYVGNFLVGEDFIAVLSINGRQQWVEAGQVIENIEILSVDPMKIEVSLSGRTGTIARQNVPQITLRPAPPDAGQTVNPALPGDRTQSPNPNQQNNTGERRSNDGANTR